MRLILCLNDSSAYFSCQFQSLNGANSNNIQMVSVSHWCHIGLLKPYQCFSQMNKLTNHLSTLMLTAFFYQGHGNAGAYPSCH